MQGFFISLQKLLSLGQLGRSRPALYEFALNYHPSNLDPEFLGAWRKLQWMLNTTEQDAALLGLHSFLRDNLHNEYARVCFSADCVVGLGVYAGSFCIEPPDGDAACCSPEAMYQEVQAVIDAYDHAYAN